MLRIVEIPIFIIIAEIGFLDNKEKIKDIINPIKPKNIPKFTANLSMLININKENTRDYINQEFFYNYNQES
ncbi:MAG: hypothetical protein KatS3mg129_1852 [Leptospiraceae bacterium]|nr:MAG: hypothetical protein KatS3mg129_1852 [Leptospiraceae bacterium]